MKRISTVFLFIVVFKTLCAQDSPAFKEIVYGHEEGVALVMTVVEPPNSNGIAVIRLISSGWKSFVPDSTYIKKFNAFTEKGQTVFLISHGSQPRYKVTEIVDQIKLAIHFICYNAQQFNIDPAKIGITGVSSGGHLSLMTALSESIIETDNLTDGTMKGLKAKDSIDNVPCKIGAIGCFCPPSNLMEFAGCDSNILHSRVARDFFPNAFNVLITNSIVEQNIELKSLSPIYYISDNTPPTIIIHGDKDNAVPLNQSKFFIDHLKKHQVPCKLVVKKGAGHTWEKMDDDNVIIAEWFEKYLPAKK